MQQLFMREEFKMAIAFNGKLLYTLRISVYSQTT